MLEIPTKDLGQEMKNMALELFQSLSCWKYLSKWTQRLGYWKDNTVSILVMLEIPTEVFYFLLYNPGEHDVSILVMLEIPTEGSSDLRSKLSF